MVRAIVSAKAENALPEVKRRQKRINIDSRGGLGYTVKGWYIFAPPSGTILLRRLQYENFLRSSLDLTYRILDNRIAAGESF